MKDAEKKSDDDKRISVTELEAGKSETTPVSSQKSISESVDKSAVKDKGDESVPAAVIAGSSSGADSNSGNGEPCSLPFRKRRTAAVSSPSASKSKKQEEEQLDTTSSSSESIINQILQIEDERETKTNTEIVTSDMITQDAVASKSEEQQQAQPEESQPIDPETGKKTSSETGKTPDDLDKAISTSSKGLNDAATGSTDSEISSEVTAANKAEKEAELSEAADDSALKAAQLLFTSLSSSTKSSSTSMAAKGTPVPTTTESDSQEKADKGQVMDAKSKLNGHPESGEAVTTGPKDENESKETTGGNKDDNPSKMSLDCERDKKEGKDSTPECTKELKAIPDPASSTIKEASPSSQSS